MTTKIRYSIVFGVWGFFISLLAAFVLAAVTASFLYFLVIGDTDPYNLSYLLELVPTIIGALTIICVTALSVVYGYHFGKKREGNKADSKSQLVFTISIIALGLFLILIVIKAYQVKYDPEFMCSNDSECGYIPHICMNVAYISKNDLEKYNFPGSKGKNYCGCINNKCKLLENIK